MSKTMETLTQFKYMGVLCHPSSQPSILLQSQDFRRDTQKKIDLENASSVSTVRSRAAFPPVEYSHVSVPCFIQLKMHQVVSSPQKLQRTLTEIRIINWLFYCTTTPCKGRWHKEYCSCAGSEMKILFSIILSMPYSFRFRK